MRPHHSPSPSEPPRRFQPIEIVLSGPARPLVAVVPVTVLALGFVALLTFWLAGDPRADVPGLFDYAAATLGDGLLLPLLALACVLALAFVPTPAPGERGWTVAGALGGLVAGAVIQATWLLDSNPNLNWTLVAPHELNTAGWWHSAFFVLASGFFGGCAPRVALRIRRSASRSERQALVESGWLATLTLCALGFLGLATADNFAAAGTQAGLATVLGVALATILFSAGLAWTFHFAIREIASPLLLGGGGAIALAPLVSYGLPVPWGAAAAGVAVSTGLGIGLSAARFASIDVARGMRIQLWIAAAVPALLTAVTLTGTLSLALHLVGNNGLVAAIAVLSGSALVTATNRSPTWDLGDLVLRVTAVAYSIGLIVLCGWVDEGRTSTEANYAVGFAAFFLDGLVLGMIRQQFAQVIRSDFTGKDESGRETEEVGIDTVIQVYAFGLGALVPLAALFAVAAPSLGLDVGSGFPDIEWVGLGVALACALALTTAARLRAKQRREESGTSNSAPSDPIAGDPVKVDHLATALAVTGLAVWLGALLWSAVDAGLNMVPIAAVGACLIGLMTVEDVIRTCTRLQLHSPDQQSLLLAGAAGATVATGLFFVLSAGLWDGGAPASPTAVMVALLVPAATIVVIWQACSPIPYGLTEEKITPQTPGQNVFLIQGLYAGLALIALILPMIAVSRINAIDPSDVGLVAVTSLATLPSLIGAFVWILGNNALHLELQLKKIKPPDDQTQELPEETKELVDRINHFTSESSQPPIDQWRMWMSTHIRFQNRTAIGVMVFGFSWMAVAILI